MTKISRRDAMLATGAAALWPALARAQARAGSSTPFSWAMLQQRAEALAKQPYRAVPPVAAAAALDYDAVGGIRYSADKTLAGGIRPFPLGKYAPVPVTLNVVANGRATSVDYAPSLFETKPGVKPAPGFAGFRVMEQGKDSDWLAYMGASYFRSAGALDQYGLSARGIAIDTGLEKEEFPVFIEFWIEPLGDGGYTIYALLDGESLTGAYRFVSRHPKAVVQDVSSVLFLRKPVARLGIAPATSMFWYDDRSHKTAADWRPEIHDSDGLAIRTAGGERVWRPLRNPAQPTTDSFAADDVRGFGLLQRDRNFDHYQDDGAFYDRRPNLWIEPQGQWGSGRVILYAFPTAGETTDNVVCFWTPGAAVRAGQRLAYDYRLTWGGDDPTRDRVAHVVDSWTGSAGRPGGEAIAGAVKLVADFVGDGLAGLTRQSGVSAEIAIARGKLLESAAYPVVGQRNRWRVIADVAPEGDGPADVRLFLKRGNATLSETLLTPLYRS
ncbi:glucans biosynthesis protein [Sphingomonas endophytica]|uniref:Glucans biosynthesis protein n=1 Tax=Sphingomonas endophytica TaxID=869719 RepID=A0A7X0JA10_9SPHN|nr:glucan biosynthesis protein [Sphingomonas endophytica]MBB6503409.1 glucans biosynthesis protein [Sphingomonas endophytica]